MDHGSWLSHRSISISISPDEDIAPCSAHVDVRHWHTVFEPKDLVSEPLIGLVLLKNGAARHVVLHEDVAPFLDEELSVCLDVCRLLASIKGFVQLLTSERAHLNRAAEG